MPQVISLLSSSPTSYQELSPTEQVKTSFGSDNAIPSDFDNTILEFEDLFDKPTSKRRRLSPISSQPSLNKYTTACQNDPFTSVSSDDRLDAPKPKHDTSRSGRYPSHNKNTPKALDIWDDDFDDPILCSSSPGIFQNHRRLKDVHTKPSTVITIDDAIDDFGEDGFDLPNYNDDIFDFTKQDRSKAYVSDRTARLLDKIKDQASSRSAPASKRRSNKRDTETILSDEYSDIPVAGRPKSKSKKAGNVRTTDKAEKALQREAAKALREKEKEEKKEANQKLKEEKARQKQLDADIAAANKSKVDKKISVSEMIVDMPLSFQGNSIGNQVVEYMHHLSVETSFIPTDIPNVVSWRRKVTARYDDEAARWEPSPLTIKREAHILCYLSAQDFVGMSVAPPGSETLDSHLEKILRYYPDSKPIYLIEGLNALMKKNQNSRNRAYQAAVIQQMNNETSQPSQTSSRGRNKKKPEPVAPVDDDTIEDALLQLQVRHRCLIHHTAAAGESAEWIKNFTQHVSTIPYRQERMNFYDASFCMDSGQVKSGENADDSYVRMLQEVNRITAPIAYGVSMEYGNVSELVNGLKASGPLRLENVKKCADRSGALTETRIGPAVSQRLYKIFTSLDPASTDI